MSNPAARLHDILSSAQRNPHSGPVLDGWRGVLGLPGSDILSPLGVMSKLGHVYMLPEVVAKEIRRFPDLDPDLFLGWEEDLTTAFRSVGFDQSFNDFRARLSKSLLLNIRHCAFELERRAPEKEVAAEDLAEIRGAAAQLYDQIVGLNLPTHLSRFLLDHLWMILEAVDNYQITGAPGLQNSVDAAVGAVTTDPLTAREVGNSAEGKKFWDTVVSRAAVALKMGKDFIQIADIAARWLPGGGNS